MTRPSSVARRRVVALALLGAIAAGCSGVPAGKPYPIRGEVVSITAARNEVVLNHEQIAGFMQAMTMSFPIARELLEGVAPGDRVEGVLLVDGARYSLVSLAKLANPANPADGGSPAS